MDNVRRAAEAAYAAATLSATPRDYTDLVGGRIRSYLDKKRQGASPDDRLHFETRHECEAELQRLQVLYDSVIEYTANLVAERDASLRQLEDVLRQVHRSRASEISLQTFKRKSLDRLPAAAEDEEVKIELKKYGFLNEDGEKEVEEQPFTIVAVIAAVIIFYYFGRFRR